MTLKLAETLKTPALSQDLGKSGKKKNKKALNKAQKRLERQKTLRKAARKQLKRFTDPKTVMEQGKALSGKKLLKLSYLAGDYPYPEKMGLEEYEHEKHLLQTELLKAQNWARQSGQRIVSLFEGRDAAGKGGTIKRFMEHLNPRAAHVVALEKPTEIERGQWYFQRYIQHLPTRGQMVFFDRSWYNRAGVEKVMGFTTDQDYLEFMRQAPALERMLVNSGLKLNKYWFSVTRQEQLRRFHSRQNDPLKQWKLSPIDLQSLDKWDDYTEAKKAMFFHTDTADAPWTVVKSDDKKRARINVMRHFLSQLDYPDKDEAIVGTPDPKIIGSVRDIYANQDEGRD
jgi:polyphosphate kinase